MQNPLKDLCIDERDCLVQYMHCAKLSQGLEKDVNQFIAFTNDHLANLEIQRAKAATICGRTVADTNYNTTLLEFLHIIRQNTSFIENNISAGSINNDTQKTVLNILRGIVDTLHKSKDMAMHVNKLDRTKDWPQNTNRTSLLSH